MAALARRAVLAVVHLRFGVTAVARHRPRLELERRALNRMTAVARDLGVFAVELVLRRDLVIEPILSGREVTAIAALAEVPTVHVVARVASRITTRARRASELLVGAVAAIALDRAMLAIERIALVLEEQRVPRARRMALRALLAERAFVGGVVVARVAALHRERFERRAPARIALDVAVGAWHRLVTFHERELRFRSVKDHDPGARRWSRWMRGRVAVHALVRRVLAVRMIDIGVHLLVLVTFLAAGHAFEVFELARR